LLTYKQNISTHYSLNYKLTGNRILQYGSDWADQINDKAFRLVSFGFSKNISLGSDQNIIKVNLTIDNLLDEEYISTIGYPEPDRSMNLTVEYKL
jgi:outer membrane cobalamin receptor